MLLAFDTATALVTVALHDGERVVTEHLSEQPMKHGEHLAPLIERSMRDAGIVRQDLSAIAVGVGPGPFTGLRVGLVTARTLGFVLDIPVYGVCSLDVIAVEVVATGAAAGSFLVATDARRKEVYAAEFTLTSNGSERVGDVMVARSTDLPERWRVLPTVGRGPLLYPDSLLGGIPSGGVGSDLLDVSAGALGDLAARRWSEGRTLPAAALEPGAGFDGLEPLYLRRPDTQPAPPSRKSTLG